MASTSNERRSRGGRRRNRGGHGCKQKQKYLTNISDVIDKALRTVCLNGGEIGLDELQKRVGRFDPDLGSLEDIVSSEPCHFEIIHCENGNVIVEAFTEAQICPKYLKKECVEGDDCQDLHICGYFATGSCCWFGPNCDKSHYFRSDHNKRILKDFRIAFLSEEQLVKLFRWSWPKFTVPDFCGQYRSKSGCQKKHCRFLHLCKNYVMENCNYGLRCKFAHDIFIEPSNVKLLERFKLNTNYCSENLLNLIKERHEGVYRPDSEVLDSPGEESEDEENEEEETEDEETEDENGCDFQPTAGNCTPRVEYYRPTAQQHKPVVVRQRSSSSQKMACSVQPTTSPTSASNKCVVTTVKPSKPLAESDSVIQRPGSMQEPKSENQPNKPMTKNTVKPVPLMQLQLPGSVQNFEATQKPKKQPDQPKIKPAVKVSVTSTGNSSGYTENSTKCNLRKMSDQPIKSKKQQVEKETALPDSRGKKQTTVKPETIPKSAKQPDQAKPETIVNLSIPSKDDLFGYVGTAESSTKFTLTKKSNSQPVKSKKQEIEKGTVLLDSRENKPTTIQVSGMSTQEQKSIIQSEQAKTNTAAVTPAMLSTGYSSGQQALREVKKTPKLKPVKPSTQLPGLNIQNTEALDAKKEEICKDHLQGKCVSGSLCQKLHCDLPYQWQILIDGEWCSVQKPTNNAMEKQFCEVIGGSVLTKLNDSFYVSFDGMFVSNTDGTSVHTTRRLEVKGEADISDVYLVSHWSWYWQDEGGKWIEYSEQNTKQNARADKESCDFESLYNAYKNENGSQTVRFSAGSQKYTLDFISMTQTNDHYGTRKAVCRRPAKHITMSDVKKYRKEKPWLHNTFPSTWDMKIRTPSSYKLVKVLKYNNEYKEIIKLFQKTLPEANITQLERVQNETRWEAFARHKEFMMKNRYGKTIDEKKLFHGTRHDRIDDICRDNFDFRLSGTSTGHVYGHGAYFAKSAKYSNDYSDPDHNNIKKMFVARVLVGSYTVGTKDMRRPPFKNPSDKTKGMYDSCVDDFNSPTIFVVFDNNQVYPEYVITYEDPKSYNQYSVTAYSSSNYGYARTNTLSSSSFNHPVQNTSTTNSASYNSSSSYNPPTRQSRRSPSSTPTRSSSTSLWDDDYYVPNSYTSSNSYSSTSNSSRSNTTSSYSSSNTYSSASSRSNATSSNSGSKNGCICM